jgi:hypothetical protein
MTKGVVVQSVSDIPDDLLPGAHVVLISDTYLSGIEGRFLGLELRDSFLVVGPKDRTRFAFLFRKDCSEKTVAGNVLRHGTGALNIDGCRVGGPPRTTHADGNRVTSLPDESFYRKQPHGPLPPPSGRWPTNLVFVHGEGCRRVGNRQVKTSTITKPYSRENRKGFAGPMPTSASTLHHGDKDGLETIQAWDCELGCPVAELDRMSLVGGIHSAGNRGGVNHVTGNKVYQGVWKPTNENPDYYKDSGGASRFFPQFENDIQLLSWFRTLIGI